VILLCGIPSEGPLARVREELDALDLAYVLFNQRRFDDIEMAFSVWEGGVSGWLRIGMRSYRLEDFTGIYTRVMDDSLLPELRAEPSWSPRRNACRTLHDTLVRWYEIAPGRVVNRSGPMGSNASKPYQAQLIQEHGFKVPQTVITNDPELVRAFYQEHGRVIYKSISGVRSIVQTLQQRDLERVDRVRWCPIQLQAYVEGLDVRVHVVSSEVFATAVRSTATDYRYATRDPGGTAELEAIDLPDDLAERCITLAKVLRLPFAGIDLKLTPKGEPFCFEVNPSPAFSYYEAHTGQPIARAVARYLVDS
jgi:hypothetical protein